MTNAAPQATTDVKKILIVEDEGDICLLLNIILDGKGMELDHVKNLADAGTYLQEEPPALIILDNKLPDGYGVDFIPYLKKEYAGLKIIMISGFDASVKDVAMENGADIFLEKPFTRKQLEEAVDTLLQA